MSRERNLLRISAAVLTATGMFTSAFIASPERASSITRDQRFEVHSFCWDGLDIYPAVLGGIKGNPVLSVFFRDADANPNRSRILFTQREGFVGRVLGPVSPEDGGPTVIDSAYIVRPVPGASANFRFAVYDAIEGLNSNPLADKTVQAPSCE